MTTLRRMTVHLAAVLVAMTSVLLVPGTPAFAVNPIVKRFAADPSILVSGNRMYLYATDDASNSGSYWDSKAWRVYSSTDLVTWTDHGAPFSIGGFRWARQYAWAPAAVAHFGSGLVCAGGLAFSGLCYALYRTMMSVD